MTSTSPSALDHENQLGIMAVAGELAKCYAPRTLHHHESVRKPLFLPYLLQDAQVVFAKSYQGEIMTTAIFFGGRFYVTLTEAAAKEQDLVDTLFPQVRKTPQHGVGVVNRLHCSVRLRLLLVGVCNTHLGRLVSPEHCFRLLVFPRRSEAIAEDCSFDRMTTRNSCAWECGRRASRWRRMQMQE